MIGRDRAVGPTGGHVEQDEPTSRWPRRAVPWVLAALAVVVVVAVAFIPRTVAEGSVDGRDYRVDASPGIRAPSFEVVVADDRTEVSARAGVAELADTSVVRLPVDAPELTVAVGPTPRGVSSIRVTSDRGVGEAVVHRVAWRRIHVEVFDGDVDVRQLVGISVDGAVVEVHEP